MLDTYTPEGEFIKTEERGLVHEQGLWHKTSHCWILRPNGKILFQMRSKKLNNNPGRLYTSASGHVLSGETIPMALKREVAEELGLDTGTENATEFGHGQFTSDFTTTDGKEFHDRALWYACFLENDNPLTDYDFQAEELEGLYEVDIANTLAFMKGETDSLMANAVFKENGKTYTKEVAVELDQFQFVNQPSPYEKFGWVLESALEYFSKK